ncbi:MAG: peptide/nickel transport system ATP-binding protein, partial [Psychroserpens sp.]
MQKEVLLDVKNLCVAFGSSKKNTEVIHDISFSINTNEVVGIVGESGSGKS